MRVLIASTFLSPHVGGVEHYVDWLRQTLAGRGHDVRLVGAASPARADLMFPSFSPGRRSFATVPVALPAPRALAHLSDLVRWADVALIQNCFYTLSFFVAAMAQVHRTPARTVVHASSNAIPGMGLPSRVVASGYAHTLGSLQLRMARPLPVSESSARFVLRQYGMDGEVIPFPLRALPLRQQPAPPSMSNPLEIVWAGRMAEAKAPELAVAAVEQLVQEQPCRLHVYGDGPLASRLPRKPWLIRHGMRPWPEVVDAQARSHVFLSTSVADNVQTSLLEALAMGVPAVATDVGEAGRYLSGNLASLLCPINDPVSLGRALMVVARDWDPFSQLAAVRGAQLCEEHNAEAVADQVEALLLRAAGTGGR